jgi:hypothetical protein
MQKLPSIQSSHELVTFFVCSHRDTKIIHGIYEYNYLFYSIFQFELHFILCLIREPTGRRTAEMKHLAIFSMLLSFSETNSSEKLVCAFFESCISQSFFPLRVFIFESAPNNCVVARCSGRFCSLSWA